jgi:hypothetical protein
MGAMVSVETMYDVAASDRALLNHPINGTPPTGMVLSAYVRLGYWSCYLEAWIVGVETTCKKALSA